MCIRCYDISVLAELMFALSSKNQMQSNKEGQAGSVSQVLNSGEQSKLVTKLTEFFGKELIGEEITVEWRSQLPAQWPVCRAGQKSY